MAAVINNQINIDQLVMAKSITIDGGGASAMIIYGAGREITYNIQHTMYNTMYSTIRGAGKSLSQVVERAIPPSFTI